MIAMNLKQIIAGVVAGVVGAAIWAAISFYANMEIGYIAWGIGILVGIAVAATGENSSLAGVTAVLITIVSLLGGKYAAVELAVQDMQAEMGDSLTDDFGADLEITDEGLQSFLAEKIAEKREADGEAIEWPEVADEEESAGAAFPEDIWAEAGKQLSKKTDDEKDSLREERKEQIKAWAENFGQALADAAREEGFIASFSMFDLLFFGLAVATAWKIASRDEEGEAA
jgi:hypothetical protein